MTRINCIDPALLTGSHLLSEYRELPRIFGLVKKAINNGKCINDFNIDTYRMGRGHVLFFYKRLGWLLSRQKDLVAECLRRGYKITHTSPDTLIEGIPEEWLGDWVATEDAIKQNMVRLIERDDYYKGVKYDYTD
jgi:deoxyribonuclease (pyrimidine dimer)